MYLMKYFVFILTFLFSVAGSAQVKNNKDVLIITHPSSHWDQKSSTKFFLEKYSAEQMNAGVFVLSLVNEKASVENFSISKSLELISNNGEISNLPQSNNYILTGGYFGACLQSSTENILSSFINDSSHITDTLSVTFLMEGIYGDIGIYLPEPKKTAYYSHVEKHIDEYGTISLKEQLRLIVDQNFRAKDFFRGYVKERIEENTDFKKMLSQYSVYLQVNDEPPERMSEGKGRKLILKILI